MRRFIARLYRSEAFLADLEAFVAEVAPTGRGGRPGPDAPQAHGPRASPTSTRATSSGTSPLVDPDNRRPVDWERRRRLLDGLLAGEPPRRETAKLFLIHRALGLRARRPEAFAGSYRPLDAGAGAFAYARGDAVIAAMPIRAGGEGERIAVPVDLRGRWRDVLGDRDLELAAEAGLGDLSGALPAALLERVDA